MTVTDFHRVLRAFHLRAEGTPTYLAPDETDFQRRLRAAFPLPSDKEAQ